MSLPLYFINNFPAEILEHFTYLHDIFNKMWSGGFFADLLKLFLMSFAMMPGALFAIDEIEWNRHVKIIAGFILTAVSLYLTAGLLSILGSVEHPFAWAWCLMSIATTPTFVVFGIWNLKATLGKGLLVITSALAQVAMCLGIIFYLEPHNLGSWITYIYIILMCGGPMVAGFVIMGEDVRSDTDKKKLSLYKILYYLVVGIATLFGTGVMIYLLYHLATLIIAMLSFETISGPLLVLTGICLLAALIIRISLPLVKFLSGGLLLLLTWLIYVVIFIYSCKFLWNHYIGVDVLIGIVASFFITQFVCRLINAYTGRFRCENCGCSGRKHIHVIKVEEGGLSTSSKEVNGDHSTETKYDEYGRKIEEIEKHTTYDKIKIHRNIIQTLKCEKCGFSWQARLRYSVDTYKTPKSRTTKKTTYEY